MTNELKDFAECIWKGDAVNTGEVVGKLNSVIANMLENIVKLNERGYDFPTEYIQNAITNLNNAIVNDDSYLLADNLYFEWAEIITVYKEWILEIENNE